MATPKYKVISIPHHAAIPQLSALILPQLLRAAESRFWKGFWQDQEKLFAAVTAANILGPNLALQNRPTSLSSVSPAA